MIFFYIFAFFICYFLNLFFKYLWSHMILYVVIEIITKTLYIAMFELPQDPKRVGKMVVVTDTDVKLLQGIVEITWLYSLDQCNQSCHVQWVQLFVKSSSLIKVFFSHTEGPRLSWKYQFKTDIAKLIFKSRIM